MSSGSSRSDFAPFTYAVESHTVRRWRVRRSPALDSSPASPAISRRRPRSVLVMRAPRHGGGRRHAVAAGCAERRLVLVAFVAPLILPVFAAMLAAGRDRIAVGDVRDDAAAASVLLSSPLLSVTRRAASAAAAAAIALPVLMVLAAPFIALVDPSRRACRITRPTTGSSRRRSIRVWHGDVNTPLRYLGSYTNIVNGVSFYLPEHPSTLDIVRSGFHAVVGRARRRNAPASPWYVPSPKRSACSRSNQRARRPAAPRRDAVAHTTGGERDAPVRYVIVIVPPA